MFIKFVRALQSHEAFRSSTNALPSVKHAETLPDQLEVEGGTFRKITYYIPGVGSRLNLVAGVLAKLHGMTTGKPSNKLVTVWLITRRFAMIIVCMVIEAYLYISQHYRTGDRIW